MAAALTHRGAGDGLCEGGALEGRGVQVLEQQLVVRARHRLRRPQTTHHTPQVIYGVPAWYGRLLIRVYDLVVVCVQRRM